MFGTTESYISTRAQIIGCAIVLAILAGIGFAVVRSGVFDNPTIYLRNESGSSVTIILTNPGLANSGSRAIVVRHPATDNARILSVPSWVEGECPTAAFPAGMGFQVTGAGFVEAETWWEIPTSWTLFPPGRPYYVRVDQQGALHVGEALPAAPPGCLPYFVDWLTVE